MIHSILGNKHFYEYCADPEFWTWLAVAHFLEISRWRYGDDLKSANLGIGAPSENFVYRLWLRAEVVLDPESNDPYELARRGTSIDFWRSHVFRTSYSVPAIPIGVHSQEHLCAFSIRHRTQTPGWEGMRSVNWPNASRKSRATKYFLA